MTGAKPQYTRDAKGRFCSPRPGEVLRRKASPGSSSAPRAQVPSGFQRRPVTRAMRARLAKAWYSTPQGKEPVHQQEKSKKKKVVIINTDSEPHSESLSGTDLDVDSDSDDHSKPISNFDTDSGEDLSDSDAYYSSGDEYDKYGAWQSINDIDSLKKEFRRYKKKTTEAIDKAVEERYYALGAFHKANKENASVFTAY